MSVWSLIHSVAIVEHQTTNMCFFFGGGGGFKELILNHEMKMSSKLTFLKYANKNLYMYTYVSV